MTSSEALVAIEDLTDRFTLFTRSEAGFERRIREDAMAIVYEGPIAPTGKRVSVRGPWAELLRDALADEWADVADLAVSCGVLLQDQGPS